MKELSDWIIRKLEVSEESQVWVNDGLVLALIFFVALLSGVIMRRFITPLLKKVVRKTNFTWDDYLLNDGVLKTVNQLVPAIVAYFMGTFMIGEHDSLFHELLWRVLNIYLIAVVLKFICAVIEAIDIISSNHESLKDRPLHGVYQMLKLIAICLGVIVILAEVIGKSPLTLITGIGAAATVLMLVFKDSIVGFVAGIQLSVNDMLRPGDWICVPKAGADGEVIDVSITTVKVQNWDKTITTIPPYALVSEAFQNWRGMQESGGRRMKRSIPIDVHFIRSCSEEEIAELLASGLIAQDDLDGENINMVLYTKSMERYMRKHALIHQGMTVMVRQLQLESEGLPVEFYCFCSDTNWVPYEHFQTQFMGHAVAILPKFGLRAFQRSTNI
jgi:miniconductance mechanosensitive channel